VQVSLTAPGKSEAIRDNAAAAQNVIQVLSTTGFAPAVDVIIQGNGRHEFGTIQSVTDKSATQFTVGAALAAGNTKITAPTQAIAALYSRGDRIIVVQGSKFETATVVSVDAANKFVFITTDSNINAPAVGLKNAFPNTAKVAVLSSITLTGNLTNPFAPGSVINTFGTVTLNAPMTLAHAKDTKITLTRTAAGNADWTARVFSVDTTVPANAAATLIVANGASGGGWNGKVPSAPHADSRSMTVIIARSRTSST
jgi:hypothetical protein